MRRRKEPEGYMPTGDPIWPLYLMLFVIGLVWAWTELA